MLRQFAAVLAGLLAGVLAMAWWPGAAGLTGEWVTVERLTGDWVPPPDTIVKVEGNKGDGFGIYYYDGSSIFPPTDSEAKAECEEYDTQLARVRCKTEVRTWYRDLRDLKRALRLANLE